MSENLIKSIAAELDLPTEQIKQLLTKPKDAKNGDLALPCFPFAKQLKTNPSDAAIILSEKITLPSEIAKVVTAGPYLNFYYNRTEVTKNIIAKILNEKSSYGHDNSNTTKTVLIDYSSPNIAKPFHIGHLRTTVIGFSLYKIFSHLGYKTVSINHLGDWGTQFGFVYAGVKIWGKSESYSLNELVELYIKANKIKKLQEEEPDNQESKKYPDIQNIARQYFIDLEAGDELAKTFWSECVEISLKYLKNIYQDLGITFDEYTGESFYIPLFSETENQLKAADILEQSEGALGIDLGEPLGFARIMTEDGRSLYLSRDITTADYREKTFEPDKILYVVGAPQSLHFKQLVAIMEKLEHPAAKKIKHIAYGHVPGIGTRSGGNSFSLDSLLTEAKDLALKAYQEDVSKRPADIDEKKVANAVALAAIYFNYLSRSNIKDFHFTWEEAVNFQGDTGPYLLYALARLNGIIAKAESEKITMDSNFNPELIENEDVYKIISILADFPATLAKISTDYEPNHLARYALSLAKEIAKNYKSLRVTGIDNPELSSARLALFTSCKHVLEVAINLLGIPSLERM